jgi:hypothetical protein
MSARAAAPVTDSLADATVDLLWRQWRALGAAAAGAPVHTQVDPEVLCLGSLAFEDQEPRLWIAMADWLRLGARLMSVQRLKNLSGQIAGARHGLPRLAVTVMRDARDARWRSLVEPRTRALKPPAPVKPRTAGPTLQAPPALVLRFRAAFGVGVKADLLAFLLGQRFRVSVATVATALGHSKPTVFRALQDLLATGLVRSTELPTAAEYWLDAPHWAPLLGGTEAVPRWGFWREVVAYVTVVTHWEQPARPAPASEYARATALRELAAPFESSLVRAGALEEKLALPRSPSLSDWRGFHAELADWITASA